MTLNQDGCREEALDFNPPVIPLGVWGQIGTLAFGLLKGQSNKFKQNHRSLLCQTLEGKQTYFKSPQNENPQIIAAHFANRKSANFYKKLHFSVSKRS